MSDLNNTIMDAISCSLDKATRFMLTGLTNDKIILTDSAFNLEMREYSSVLSVYLPSYILHSLSFMKQSLEISKIRLKISKFLILQKENNGIWRFFGKNNPFPPPDFDDTSCVYTSLKENGINVDTDMLRLLSKCKSDSGLYYTWLDEKMNKASQYHIDGGVNSNILYFGAINGVTFLKIAKFINQYSVSFDFQAFSVWSVSRYASLYLVSRVYRDGKVVDIKPAIRNITEVLITNQETNGSWGNPLDTILGLATLVNVGGNKNSILRAIKHLVLIQDQNGDFGLNAAFRDLTPVYYGSRYFTTAVFIEALTKFISRGI